MWQQVQHHCLSVSIPFWKALFFFSQITLNYIALEVYEGMSSSVSFLFLSCDAGGKTRRKYSLLQLGSHTGSGHFLSLGRNCWDTLLSSSRLELFEDISSSFNCFKFTVVILVTYPSFLKIGASFFIFLAL